MCVILDADSYGDFLDPQNANLRPLRKWMRDRGKLVYTPTRKMRNELEKCEGMKKRLVEYTQAGRIKEVEKDEVDAREAELRGLSSNDGHIVALAIVARVKVLVSRDRNLHEDFKRMVKGRVYQNEKHQHLLRRDTCP